MKIEQLIRLLQDEVNAGNGELDIMFAYSSHWHTTICKNVNDVKMAKAKWSKYHENYVLEPEPLTDEVNDDEDDKIILN